MTESWTLSPQASNCKNGKKQVRREGGKPDGMTERYNHGRRNVIVDLGLIACGPTLSFVLDAISRRPNEDSHKHIVQFRRQVDDEAEGYSRKT